MKFINYKRLLLVFIPIVALAFWSIDAYYNQIFQSELEIVESSAESDLKARAVLVSRIYEQVIEEVNLIHWEFSKDFAESEMPKKEEMESFFSYLACLNKNLDQIRFIDTLGNEAICVNYDSISYVVTDDQLQDESDRYYFKSIKQLEGNEIYFSRIDSNVKNANTEKPYNPVLRVAKKVYSAKGQWIGVLLFNYHVDDLIKRLERQSNLMFTSFELVNDNESFIVTEDTNKSFFLQVDQPDSLLLLEIYTELRRKSIDSSQGQVKTEDAVYLYDKIEVKNVVVGDIRVEGKGELLLINRIDLEELHNAHHIYRLYQKISYVIVFWVTLLVVISVQYYNNRLKTQNKALEGSNDELKDLKIQLEQNLHLKLEELKLTEKKFYSLFAHAGIGITLVNTEGYPVFSNKKLEDILGYTEGELTQMTFADFTHPDDIDVDMKQFNDLLNRKIKSYNMEKRYICKDGRIIWGDLNVSLLLDSDDQIINVIGTVSDITDKKNNEIILFENNQIMNQVVDAITSTDNSGNINYWNKAAELLFGYSEDEIKGCPISNLYSYAIGQRVFKQVLDTLKEKDSISFEEQMLKKNGEEFYAKVTVSNKYDSQGHKIGRIGSISDITEKKEDELNLIALNKDLEDYVRFLNNTMDYSPFAMWIANPDGQVVRTNDALRNILQLTEEQILNNYNVLQDQNLVEQGVMDEVKRVFEDHATTRFEIIWRENTSGVSTFKREKEYYLDLSLFPIVDDDGNLQNVVCQWLDVTERRLYEKAIVESENKFRGYVENVPNGVFVLNEKGHFVEVNKSIVQLTGYTQHELLDNSFMHILDAKDQSQASNRFRDLVSSAVPVNLYIRIVHRSGVLRYINSRIVKLSSSRYLGFATDVTELKKAEEEIVVHRNKLVTILETAPTGIGQVVNRVFMDVNTRFCKMLGYTKEELIGQSTKIIYPSSEEYKRVGENEYSELETKAVGRFETVLVTKEGKLLDIDTSLTLVDPNDLTKGYIFTALDITEKKKAERQLINYQQHLEEIVKLRTQAVEASNVKLQENQYRLDAAFTSSGYAWWDLRVKEGLFLTHSAKYEGLGYSESEVSPHFSWWYKRLHSDDQKVIHDISRKLKNGADTFNCEVRLKHKNGNYLWYNERGSVIERGDNSAPLRMIGTSEDITSDKNNRLELIKLSEAVQQSPVVVVITDKKARIEYVNPAFETLSGYTPDEIIGKNPRILNAGVLPKSVYKDLWTKILSGKTWEGELCNKTKSGEIFWENAVITPVFDDYGEIVNFIAVKENITDRKRAMEELKQAKLDAEAGNRAKSEFLANMSHEIRTPMNAVIGFTDILLRKLTHPQHLKHLESIKASSKNLLAIINDILDVSKIDAGKLDINYVPLDLVALLEELETIFSVQATERGLLFETNVHDLESIYIMSDDVRIRQILYNLISNALKFTLQGVVSVRLRQGDIEEINGEKFCSLQFCVEDTGIGISEEKQESVFESFVQQEGQDYKTFGGTGLGLTISKKLAKLLGGDILLDSKMNEGSKFTLDLVRVKVLDRVEVVDHDASSDLVTFDAKHVLVIDDIASNREFLKSILHDLGLIAHAVTNGLEGLDMLEHKSIDLIITDVKMPKLDGYGVVDQLRKGKHSNIPCIAATASAHESEIDRIEKSDFNAFVLKPIQVDELIEVLKQYLPYHIHSQEKEKLRVLNPISEDQQELISQDLEQLILPLYVKLKDQQSFEDLNAFADVVYNTGLKYSVEVLCLFAERMKEAIEAFDIASILELNKSFATLINIKSENDNK